MARVSKKIKTNTHSILKKTIVQDVIKKLIIDLSINDNSEYKTIKSDIQTYIETELIENIQVLLQDLTPKDVIIELDKITLDLVSIINRKANNLEFKNLKNNLNQSLQKAIKKAIEDSIADPQKRNIHPLPIAMFNAILNYLKNGYFDWWISSKNQKTIEQIYTNLLNNSPELICKLWDNSNIGQNLNEINRFTSQFDTISIQNTIKIITKEKYEVFNSIFYELDSISHLIKEKPLNKSKYKAYLYTSIIFNSLNPKSVLRKENPKEEILDACITTLSSIADLSKPELKYLTKISDKDRTSSNSIYSTTQVIKTLDSIINNDNSNKSDLELNIIVDALKDLCQNISPIETKKIAQSLEKINPQLLFIEKIIKQLKPSILESFLRYKDYLFSIENSSLHKNFFSLTMEYSLQRNVSISEYNIAIDTLIKNSISNENISSQLEYYFNTGIVPKQYKTDQNFLNFLMQKEENVQILYSSLKGLERKTISKKVLEQLIKPFISHITVLSNTILSEYEKKLSTNLQTKDIDIQQFDLQYIIYTTLLSILNEKKSNINLLDNVTNNISKSLKVNLEDFHINNESQKSKQDIALENWIRFIDLGEIDSHISPRQLLSDIYSLPDEQQEKILTNSINSSIARNRIIAYFNREEIEKIILCSTNKNILTYAKEILEILNYKLKQTSTVTIYNICIDKFLIASIDFNNHRQEKKWLQKVLSLITTEIDLSKDQLTNILLSNTRYEDTVEPNSLNQLLSSLNQKNKEDKYIPKTNNEISLIDFLSSPKDSIKDKNPNIKIIEEFIKNYPKETIKILFQYAHLPNIINNLINNLNLDIIHNLIKNFSPLSYTWIKDNILLKLPDNLNENQKIALKKKNISAVLEYYIYINKEDNKALNKSELTEFWSNSIYLFDKSEDLKEDLSKDDINIKKEIDQYSKEKTLYIDNGAIAILWPFLEDLFERLGFMKKSEFIDEASHNNAIHILNYLCTNRLSTSEWKLVLPKILCGISTEKTIYFSYEPNSGPLPRELELIDSKHENEEILIEKLKILEEKEQNIYLEVSKIIETCNNWLNDLIKEWPELSQVTIQDEFQGNFTLENFKQYFLQRKCILRKITKTDNIFWHLTIPMHEYDSKKIMPNWSLETIELPWKKEKLIIHWM